MHLLEYTYFEAHKCVKDAYAFTCTSVQHFPFECCGIPFLSTYMIITAGAYCNISKWLAHQLVYVIYDCWILII